MKGNIEERACRLALYIIENRATVRAAARQFGISKSTVCWRKTRRNVTSGAALPHGENIKEFDKKSAGC